MDKRKCVRKKIQDKVVELECKKLGLYATKEEAENRVRESQQFLLNMLENGTDDERKNAAEAIQNIEAYTKQLGLTYEEYTKHCLVPAEIFTVSVDKLYVKFAEENQIDKKSAYEPFQQYKRDLKKHYKITIK